MVKLILSRISVCTLLLGVSTAAAATESLMEPQIRDVTILNSTVELFGKMEAVVDIEANYSNPFDYDQVWVSGHFTAPSGQSKTIDGFFMQDFTLNGSSGSLSIKGEGSFRLRFSPNETGTWTFRVFLKDQDGEMASEEYTFHCVEASSELNHGFVRAGNSNYLQFDDGASYIPIGENIAWQDNNPYIDYKNWLDQLSANNGNFFRLWHAHWGLGLEWSTGNGFLGLRNYKQTNCFYQDWLFDFCAENGIYVMLTLQHHGPVSTQVNPNWNESPYNAANGGPCQNTLEFFNNEEALAHTENRFRYIVARWGYARSILCWELFNEVHWTDQFESNKDIVADWHFKMGEFLKNIDPNKHLITTSYGEGLVDERVWAHPDFSFTQTHVYLNNPNLERALAAGLRSHLEQFGKPALNGEFGLRGVVNLAEQDPDGIHFHNALWGGLFSGGLGSGMSWWWESYIHPQNLYHHFWGVSQLSKQVPFVEKKMQPAESIVQGAPGDLSLIPVLSWAGIGEKNISIDQNGHVEPATAALGEFLYGSQWNTQYRSPPVFSVNYPQEGKFIVKTANDTGMDPKIAIWLDDELILEENAVTNSTYSVDIPAGEHTIRVDNTGTDWITIAAYAFEGLGSQVDAYVLISEDRTRAAGWILNNLYNHANIKDNGIPEDTPACNILIDDFEDGAYVINWYDPQTGQVVSTDQLFASNQVLDIVAPPFSWDLAFIVEGTILKTEVKMPAIDFELYPNPVTAGNKLNIRVPKQPNEEIGIRLLDGSGREVKQWLTPSGNIQVPSDLPGGVYWLHLSKQLQAGIRPFIIIP